MNGIEITARGISRPRWAVDFAVFLKKAMEEMGEQDREVSVLLCDDEVMRGLNDKYRHMADTTDVLSFPQADGAPGQDRIAGDIVISLETLRRNAARLRVSEEDELKRLGVHGLLHLAGMDHGQGKSGAMLRRQEEILDTLKRARIPAADLRR
jgi:probable rRNA maturation factor